MSGEPDNFDGRCTRLFHGLVCGASLIDGRCPVHDAVPAEAQPKPPKTPPDSVRGSDE